MLAVLVSLLACAAPPVSTPTPAARPRPSLYAVAPYPTDSVAPGTIRGVVVDDSTGRGVAGARVYIARANVGAITDVSGRFKFSLPPLDTAILRAQQIGYSEQEVQLRLSPSRGYAAVFALWPRAVFLCGNDVGFEPAVIVLVRDALSGRAPSGGATVVVTSAGHRDSVSIPAAQGDSALVFRLLTGVLGLNKYSIVARSPGFRAWRADDVPAVPLPCGGAVFRPLHVWLVPE